MYPQVTQTLIIVADKAVYLLATTQSWPSKPLLAWVARQKKATHLPETLLMAHSQVCLRHLHISDTFKIPQDSHGSYNHESLSLPRESALLEIIIVHRPKSSHRSGGQNLSIPERRTHLCSFSEPALLSSSSNAPESHRSISRGVLAGPRQEEKEPGEIANAQQDAGHTRVPSQRKPLMSFAPSSNKGLPDQVITQFL